FPVKLATGISAPVPETTFVLLPSLPVVTITTLLKLATLSGAKRITKLVAAKLGSEKGVPERIVKGPPLIVAIPLLSGAPPRFIRAKLACVTEPTATAPKFRFTGDTVRRAGVRPEPVTGLVLLPPLLVNTTTLLALNRLIGAKLTDTKPVCPG